MEIRPAMTTDNDSLWKDLLEPTFRAGETYCMPRDCNRSVALAYWHGSPHRVFVATICNGDEIVGTYFLTPNQRGGGAHVCNCGFIVAPAHQRKGVARAMLADSFSRAQEAGFRAMQFNFVVSTNTRALATWQKNGFSIVGRLPGAFNHPTAGYVDAFVLYKTLDAGKSSVTTCPVIERSLAARKAFVVSHGAECPHHFTLMWDNKLCARCSEPLPKTRVASEQASASRIRQEDKRLGAATKLHERVVTVAWLLEFTAAHDCWHWPTWRVVQDIVKPATYKTRQRFTELLPRTSAGERVVPVFVSHCWGAQWGVLVSAVADSVPARGTVWIDAFAVRQWPGNVADLDFSLCISHCRSVSAVVLL